MNFDKRDIGEILIELRTKIDEQATKSGIKDLSWLDLKSALNEVIFVDEDTATIIYVDEE